MANKKSADKKYKRLLDYFSPLDKLERKFPAITKKLDKLADKAKTKIENLEEGFRRRVR